MNVRVFKFDAIGLLAYIAFLFALLLCQHNAAGFGLQRLCCAVCNDDINVALYVLTARVPVSVNC